MDLNLGALWLWLYENPVLAALIVVYLIANVAPRPHPDELVGWKKVFWTVVDRLSVLSAAALPGRLKLPFVASSSERNEITAKPKTEADKEKS